MEKDILNYLLYDVACDNETESNETKKTGALFCKLIDFIEDNKISQAIEMLYLHYGTCNFNDGFIYAMQIMKSYQNLIDDPKKYYAEFLKSQKSFYDCFRNEIMLVRTLEEQRGKSNE